MDSKLEQVSRFLKRYDSDLYPKRNLDGSLGIFKKRRGWDFYQFEGYALWFSRDFDELEIPVTDTWSVRGTPVDWGIEPLLAKIQELDPWRDDKSYDKFCEEREQNKKNKERAHRNDVRAIAHDLRKDFARATNDINTSTLEKIDNRRIKDGYRR